MSLFWRNRCFANSLSFVSTSSPCHVFRSLLVKLSKTRWRIALKVDLGTDEGRLTSSMLNCFWKFRLSSLMLSMRSLGEEWKISRPCVALTTCANFCKSSGTWLSSIGLSGKSAITPLMLDAMSLISAGELKIRCCPKWTSEWEKGNSMSSPILVGTLTLPSASCFHGMTPNALTCDLICSSRTPSAFSAWVSWSAVESWLRKLAKLFLAVA